MNALTDPAAVPGAASPRGAAACKRPSLGVPENALHGPPSSSRSANVFLAVAIVALVLLGLLLHPVPHGRQEPYLTLFGAAIPTTCWFRLTTGIPCAGCGLTRSVVLLLHGHRAASFALHPFGAAFLALSLLQLPPRLAKGAGSAARWIPWWDRTWLAAAALTAVLTFGWWAWRVGVLPLLTALSG